MPTLLEKAQSVSRSKSKYENITDEDIDLVMAWVSGEITSNQVFIAKGYKNGKTNSVSANVLYYIASTIRRAVQRNLIQVTVNMRNHDHPIPQQP